MDTTPEFFNNQHSVQDVLRGKVQFDLPTKPEEIDLRFLRMIRLSDTWEGDGSPDTGTDYVAVLYGNQIAWQRDKFFLQGERQMRGEQGNKVYHDLYAASQLYLKILKVAGALFHGEKIEKGLDTFYVREEDLALILEHPQYKEMVRDFGLELKPAKKSSYFTVTISKFYERPTR